MEIQHQVNIDLYERFEELGVEFAFPTRTVVISNGGKETGSGRIVESDLIGGSNARTGGVSFIVCKRTTRPLAL